VLVITASPGSPLGVVNLTIRSGGTTVQVQLTIVATLQGVYLPLLTR
jgi:hypothetical protein